MSGRWHTIIRGGRLRQYLERSDPKLAATIDPCGVEVVVISSVANGGRAIRAELLAKVVGSKEPCEVTLEVPIEEWNRMSESLWAGPAEGQPN